MTDYNAAPPTTNPKRTVTGLPLTGTQTLFLGNVALLLLAGGSITPMLRRRRLTGSGAG